MAEPKMMTFHVPDDASVLAAVGEVTIRHTQLDFVLRRTIKTLANLTVEQGDNATRRQGSAILRERIAKLAKQRLGEGRALLLLQALLERCRQVTERRNDLVHSLWAKELDGAPFMHNGQAWGPLPTAEVLRGLAAQIATLSAELNDARLEGFIAEALSARGRPV